MNIIGVFGVALCVPYSALYAQNLPSSADAGRVVVAPVQRLPVQRIIPPKEPSTSTQVMPKGAQELVFDFHSLSIEGMTAFAEGEFAAFYRPLMGTRITLAQIYEVAQVMTRRYHDAGYFLSRAIIPAQEIDGGHITLRVIEGRVGEVLFDSPDSENNIIQQLTSDLLANAPVKASDIESYVLRLNDLAGVAVYSTVEAMDGTQGTVRLRLVQSAADDSRGQVSFSNYGSRFLGPHQLSASYQMETLPHQRTTISGAISAPMNELQTISLHHEMAFAARWKAALSANYTNAEPGHSLASNDIVSDSKEVAVRVSYQPIRQRQKNLELSLQMRGKNSTSDAFGNTFSQDKIRTLEARVDYDVADALNGINVIGYTLSKGMGVFGGSDKGDANLSRSEANPNFLKHYASYTRQQFMGADMLLTASVAGQYSADPLFSSEEFGYGGQRMGRAYDSSEVTGDRGVSSSLELRYLGMSPWQGITASPFAFYDIGKAWQADSAGGHVSASSAGLGVYASHDSGLSGAFTLAQPLTLDVSTPLYGRNGRNPRFSFQLSQGF